jgi:small subunit ribosomal protein S6
VIRKFILVSSCGIETVIDGIMPEKQLEAGDQKEVQTAMNKYELALVVDTKIDDEVKNSVVQKAKDLIAKLGGTVTNVDEWGKKKLAYEIEKRTEGFYYFIQFDAEPTVPAGMEQDLRIMDNVLRYLVVRQEA